MTAAAQTPIAHGLTLRTVENAIAEGNALSVSCSTQPGAACNPFRGDTPCDTALPPLCLLDLDAPVPTTLEDDRHWTGSLLALGAPMRGDSVATIGEADAVCAGTFGDGWRMARYRDGGGESLVGFGAAPTAPQSVWVDIKDQPRATCWTR